MIEEIVQPDKMYALYFLVVAIGCMAVGLVFLYKFDSMGGVVIMCLAFPIIFIGFAIPDGMPEWREAVQVQVDTLDCKDLQEAYEIYKKEFIKEKFLFECVETRDMWYK